VRPWKGEERRHRADGADAQGESSWDARISSTASTLKSQLSVCDGRTALGTVELVDRRYIVRDLDGAIVSRFQDLRSAIRALPGAPS
jgi:hypothetical protein